MSGRTIGIKQVMDDIRTGLELERLREKYKLSEKGLSSLLKQLEALGLMEDPSRAPLPPGNRRISVRDLVRDIRSGVSADQLLERHGLDPVGLDKALFKLKELNAVDGESLSRLRAKQEVMVVATDFRDAPRYIVDFETPIWKLDRPEVQGRLIDIAAGGVGLVGLSASVDEESVLVIMGDPTGHVLPFQFAAKCRWSRSEAGPDFVRAGFEITSIVNEARRELHELIRLAAFPF